MAKRYRRVRVFSAALDTSVLFPKFGQKVPTCPGTGDVGTFSVLSQKSTDVSMVVGRKQKSCWTPLALSQDGDREAARSGNVSENISQRIFSEHIIRKYFLKVLSGNDC